MLSKNAQNLKKSSNLQGKLSQNKIFWMHIFVQKIWFFFKLKSDTLWKFYIKIWRVVKNLIWYTTRCKIFVIKSDKIWKILIRNLNSNK